MAASSSARVRTPGASLIPLTTKVGVESTLSILELASTRLARAWVALSSFTQALNWSSFRPELLAMFSRISRGCWNMACWFW